MGENEFEAAGPVCGMDCSRTKYFDKNGNCMINLKPKKNREVKVFSFSLTAIITNEKGKKLQEVSESLSCRSAADARRG
jgi:hypothetical protein